MSSLPSLHSMPDLIPITKLHFYKGQFKKNLVCHFKSKEQF